MLHQHGMEIDEVINFGIAGAYLNTTLEHQANMLDICLAQQEVFADLGICLQDRIERFSADFAVRDSFMLDSTLLSKAGKALQHAHIVYKQGIFITVNCASGTQQRGTLLSQQFQGLCENMEGAAVTRVCEQFSKPCLEVRCISNMVEDRNKMNWQLPQACSRAGQATAAIVDHALHQ
ncbi:MAG: futalosine hydrolase [Candidatus Electrothrix sp. AR3]|nr:futalosine hydrolase [Candidatus Electrothrix sp. AR3]